MNKLRATSTQEHAPGVYRIAADGCHVYWLPASESRSSALQRLWNKCERSDAEAEDLEE